MKIIIGYAYKKSDQNENNNRSIDLRCGQNLSPRDIGATFRNRIIKEKLKLEVYKEVREGEKRKK